MTLTTYDFMKDGNPHPGTVVIYAYSIKSAIEQYMSPVKIESIEYGEPTKNQIGSRVRTITVKTDEGEIVCDEILESKPLSDRDIDFLCEFAECNPLYESVNKKKSVLD